MLLIPSKLQNNLRFRKCLILSFNLEGDANKSRSWSNLVDQACFSVKGSSQKVKQLKTHT